MNLCLSHRCSHY